MIDRIWQALRDVEDPEIPVSVVDMGLIVEVACADRVAHLTITYTAMGCPAMEMIQDDIRRRLLQEPDIDEVHIDVTWDPAWTRERLSTRARHSMRGLGIVA
jgi:metal-sulfur cluster biosynthetic enzyme